MTTTLTRKRRIPSRKVSVATPQQVQQMLLELAYRLHATKAVKRPDMTCGR